MSKHYEERGLTEVCVDNGQIDSIHSENNRERFVNRGLQKDIEMLQSQLQKSEEIRADQESQILEQKNKLAEMHESHQN